MLTPPWLTAGNKSAAAFAPNAASIVQENKNLRIVICSFVLLN
jgi:hypothetical protein